MSTISKEEIFNISSAEQFEQLVLRIFKIQATENPVYASYLSYLGVDKENVQEIDKIPFLPIEFFKTKDVILRGLSPSIIFSSSGTTGMQQSKHLVSDVSIYEHSYRNAFHLFYGPIKNMAILALLPSYLERTGSSLIYMVDDLISGGHPAYSDYFLYNHEALAVRMQQLKESNTPALLIGVTYALLDFIENFPMNFPNLMVMETGGMKGKRKEMIRIELHEILRKGFGVDQIHSEYGMTELLSQAYSKGNGIFKCPPWMKVMIRDVNDPLAILPVGKTGVINVIDLANINSCSFIATQDLGRTHHDGTFEIMGRFDQSDIRGCNLLIQ
ncbi:acyl transferase [Olivibacter sp. SDN3]|uniref:LuxE/PaaK family acyltransferase n=1 Tax=Olivibacter sp. SDN3 TaxID=2764720 RepID=UPI0016519DA1|nr:acyl transferase [Olivibacter sp. SDN3]QNL49431.1 acyl transferase [Olivibacter sp. SDN3]